MTDTFDIDFWKWVSEIVTGVVVPLVSSIVLALAWWAKRRFLNPLLDLYAHLAPLVSDVAATKNDVAAIKSEVQTNGGASLKDEVRKIRDNLATVDARQRGLIAMQARPTFETDNNFNWIMTNRALEILTGFGFSHLERRRWVARIHDDDRDHVMEEVRYAIKDGRAASASFRFVSEAGELRLRLEATPIFSPLDPSKVICWYGSLLPDGE
jgi:PAS domain-containing protein